MHAQPAATQRPLPQALLEAEHTRPSASSGVSGLLRARMPGTFRASVRSRRSVYEAHTYAAQPLHLSRYTRSLRTCLVVWIRCMCWQETASPADMLKQQLESLRRPTQLL